MLEAGAGILLGVANTLVSQIHYNNTSRTF